MGNVDSWNCDAETYEWLYYELQKKGRKKRRGSK
jgi:hypothetical protein